MSRRDGFRILLDTNIILDAVCPTRPQSKEACLVLRRCSGEGDMGFVTSGSLKDAYYVLSKQYGEPAARAAVHHLMGLLIVAPTSAEDCLMSIESNEPDFEDGLIRACAELNDMDFIITRDEAAFRKSKVRAVDCAEYLSICDEADADLLARLGFSPNALVQGGTQ